MHSTEHASTHRPRLISLASARRIYFADEISDSMMRKLVSQNELPACRVGRRVLVSEADVEAYIARQRGQGAGGDVVALAGR